MKKERIEKSVNRNIMIAHPLDRALNTLIALYRYDDFEEFTLLMIFSLIISENLYLVFVKEMYIFCIENRNRFHLFKANRLSLI